jgi:hypothetical protein
MAHPVSRRKIAVPVVLALAASVIALAVAAWPRGGADAGGDPGGRLMAKIAPVVAVVPGFGHGRVPWIAPPCDSCQFPAVYAIKFEPQWDSCDGRAGTFGWDPVVIQAGFLWTGSGQALVDLLNERLSAQGWARGAEPPWATAGGDADWISPRGHAPTEDFALSAPIPPGKQWMAIIEARPHGRLVKGC